MKKIFLIFLLIITKSFAANILDKAIDKINIFDNRPKWVKKIDRNQLIEKNGYQCYQSKINASSYNKGKQLIEDNIKKQILSSIVSYVNSTFKVNKEITNKENYKQISTNLDVSSFGQINGVFLKHYYYDEGNQIAYGYICITNNKYNQLKNLNKERIKKFTKLYNKFNFYINNNDKEGAINILQQIQIEFPEYANTKYFKEMQKKVKQILNYHIQIPRIVNIGDTLFCKIFTDKTVYLNVVINNSNLAVTDKVIQPNKLTKLQLLPYVNDIKIKLTFYLSYTPLNLQTFILNNSLSQKYSEYILNYQLNHFLIKKEYTISAKNNNICVVSHQKQIESLVDELNDDTLKCNKNSYILLKEEKTIYNNIVKLKYKLILYKNNIPVNLKKKTFRCYKNNLQNYYEEYIIPELQRSIEEMKNE